MKSQNERILTHLKIAPITPLEAFKYMGSLRLGARIFDLKRQGHNIVTEIVRVTGKNGETKRVAKYRLIQKV